MVTIKLLGPVSLEVRGRPVPTRSVRTRSVLAVVGLAQGQPVSVGRLVDQIWGACLPNSAVQQVHNTVSQLRRAVSSAAAAEGLDEPDWLRTGANGYRLGPAAEVDLALFLDDVRHAERAYAAGHSHRAGDLIDQGLARWHGEALSGTSPHVASEAARIEAQRRVARVSRIRMALETGDAVDLRQEAESLLAEDPFDEQVRVFVMRILDLQGRRKDALHVFREGARLLRGELGVDPGVQLRHAHQAILDGTTVERTVDPAHGADPPVPAQLPPAPGAFVGRSAELARLLSVLTTPHAHGRPAIVVVSGIGGVGKTSLAVVAGHAVADRFPDGQVFVHLREPPGPLDSKKALARVLRALGFADRLPATVDERRALLRTLTAHKAILIVADDADSAGQICDLLPSEPRCAVVVTTRRRLPDLLWCESLELRPLAPDPSRQLLAAFAGDALPPISDPDISTIVEACSGLPLALAIAGARMKSLGPGRHRDLARVLDAESSRLQALSLGELDVSETLSQGLSLLSPDARRALVAVSGLTSPSIPDWCILAACDADRWRALAATDELMAAHLLHPTTESDRLSPRFGMHELVRLHLRPRLMSDADGGRQALETTLVWWLTLAREVSAHLTGEPFETSLAPEAAATAPADVVKAAIDDPAGWARRDQHNLVAAAQAAIALGRDELAVALVDASRRPLIACWLQDTWETLTTLGMRAARRSSNSRVRGRALLARGSVFLNTGDYPAAVRALWLAKELLYGVDWAGAAVAAGNLAGALEVLGEPRAAVRNCDDLLDVAELAPMARSITLRRRANAHASLGQLDAALSDFAEARRQLPYDRNWETRAHLLEGEARLHLKLCRPAEARSRLTEAIDSARAHGSPRVEGYLLLTMAEIEQACGEFDAAMGSARRATSLMSRMGDRDGEALAAYQSAMVAVASGSVATARPWLATARALLQATSRPVELAAVERLLLDHGVAAPRSS